MSMARAKSLAVPVGMTPSGQPGVAARRAASPIEPSPPATTMRSASARVGTLDLVDVDLPRLGSRGAQEVGDLRGVGRTSRTSRWRSAGRARGNYAHIVPVVTALPELGARRSLRARFAAGPVGRRIALFDVRYYRLLRVPKAQQAPLAAFSRCGEHAACWIVIGGVGMAVDSERRDRWRRGLIAVVAAYLAQHGAQERRAPQATDLRRDAPLDLHADQALVPERALVVVLRGSRAYSGLLPAAPLYALASAMAVSRVALGVHYPSDIVAGAALGTVIGGALR